MPTPTPRTKRSIPRPSLPVATPLQPFKRALIIGASSGMGAALARRLAGEGYLLALVARRGELLDELAQGINTIAGETRSLTYIHDVGRYDDVPQLLRRIVADLGGLDLVVYAAGVNNPPGPSALNFEGDRSMLGVNLVGAFAWLNPAAELFRSAGKGQIVGISSVAGDRGRVANPGYNASKAGFTSYLESLRNRLTRHGVNVITVKPGFVQTGMLKAAQRVMFAITAEQAANAIFAAIRRRKQTVYVPGFWRPFMWAIMHTPSFIFRRLSI